MSMFKHWHQPRESCLSCVYSKVNIIWETPLKIFQSKKGHSWKVHISCCESGGFYNFPWAVIKYWHAYLDSRTFLLFLVDILGLLNTMKRDPFIFIFIMRNFSLVYLFSSVFFFFCFENSDSLIQLFDTYKSFNSSHFLINVARPSWW